MYPQRYRTVKRWSFIHGIFFQIIKLNFLIVIFWIQHRLTRLLRRKSIPFDTLIVYFFCIVRPFEFGGLTRLIRSIITNWRPSKFFYILMIQSHERSIKSFTAAQCLLELTLSNVQSKWITGISQQVDLKISYRIFPNPTILRDDFPRTA